MMNNKKIILFDIDYTLFQTDHFRNLLYTDFAKTVRCSISEMQNIAQRAEKETKKQKGLFDPQTWIALIQQHFSLAVTKEALEKIFWNDALFKQSLESNIVEILTALQKKGYTIGIFSTGESVLQRKKIETIQHLVTNEHVYILANKLTSLENILHAYYNETLIIVDDLPIILAAAKQDNPGFTTILRQNEKQYEQTNSTKNFHPDYTIKHLSELLSIL
jgi:FMN phosphatase YigB (HAD superfamily)